MTEDQLKALDEMIEMLLQMSAEQEFAALNNKETDKEAA